MSKLQNVLLKASVRPFGIVHRRLALDEFKLFAQASHQTVEEWLTNIDADVPRHTISIDDVRPHKVNHIFFFHRL